MHHLLYAARLARISTHAPAGGATRVSPMIAKDSDFYSRPCGRGDQGESHDRKGLGFLLTPLREGRPGLSANEYMETVFLLTPLREGRLTEGADATAVIVFLLTPLREGRLYRIHSDFRNVPISTHAPAGGATRWYRRVYGRGA